MACRVRLRVGGHFLGYPKEQSKEKHEKQLQEAHTAVAKTMARSVLKLEPIMRKGSRRGDIPELGPDTNKLIKNK